jgi:hypothetical protein
MRASGCCNADNPHAIKAAFRTQHISVFKLLLRYGATVTQATLDGASRDNSRSSSNEVSRHRVHVLMFRYAIANYDKMFFDRFGLTMPLSFKEAEPIVEHNETLRCIARERGLLW